MLAARITLDFDVRYGLDKSWTPAQFTEVCIEPSRRTSTGKQELRNDCPEVCTDCPGGMAAALALALLTVSLAEAHHSYAATFDVDHHITLEGKVTQFGFRNPHSYLQIEVSDGKAAPCAGPSSGAARLHSESGYRRGTLKVGDVVKVRGIASPV